MKESSFADCIWGENICLLFGSVRCIEVSFDGGSNVFTSCLSSLDRTNCE